MPKAPLTAYKPGTHLTVGSHEVDIIKFIGEGGFAHVYTVTTTPPIPGQEVACLKRVQVPNKIYLNLLRAEVGAMQQLKGCSNVVQYIDSHAERMHSPEAQGQYEVFLLMEFCEGGGLIDFMNTRLRDQLREHEILKIMYDITLGLSHMHYLQPALLHRDLKIENVLITKDGTFKLCDFGSVSPVLRAPTTPQEFKILDDDIQHHTTVQYRSPEMLNITATVPIDEKSDIWALGIFLYKLCFYTTPFERTGQTFEQFKALVLSSTFQMPQRPAYSERLKNMIRVLLQPDPRMRPNVFQVMQEICAMKHVECPIQDIYQRPRPVHTTNLQQPPLQLRPLSIPGSSGAPVAAGYPATSAGPATTGGPLPGSNGGMVNNLPQVASAPQMALPQSMSQGMLSMHLPVSPAVNAISDAEVSPPLSPLPDISTKYPSLEELDKINTPLIDLHQPALAPTPTTAVSPGPTDAVPKGPPQGAIQPPPKGPKPQINVVKPPQDSINTPAQKVDEFPMPSRPRRQLPQPPVDSVDTSLDDSLESSYSSGEEVSNDEAAKLKKILTGISSRPSTVILDHPPDANQNLSSVDFLKTLNTDQGDKKSKHHLHKPRKPSFSRFYRKTHKNFTVDSDNESDEIDLDDEDSKYAASNIMRKNKDPRQDFDLDSPNSNDDFDPSSSPSLNSHSISAPNSPRNPPIDYTSKPKFSGKPKLRDPEEIEQLNLSKRRPIKPKPMPSFDKKPILPPKHNKHMDSDAVSEVSVNSTGSFMPSNAIQLRVQQFLNSHDEQHPPKRSAQGYGKFTDEMHELRRTKSAADRKD